MIVANGCPKTGTHALMRALHFAGLERVPGLLDGVNGKLHLRGTKAFPRTASLTEARKHNGFVHGHVPVEYSRALSDCLVITIYRDPRDTAVSYARWYKITLIDAIQKIVPVYQTFLGWEKFGPVVRYEDLRHYACRLPNALYDGANRDHDTFTGSPSNWEASWTDEGNIVWNEMGGPDLLEQAGYK